MFTRLIKHTLPVVVALVAACGGESRQPEPPRRVTVTATPGAPLAVTASRDLAGGICEAITGDMLRRPGLHGEKLTIDPLREIVALFDSTGALAYYRDMVRGVGGYAVRVDVTLDSASVLDRSTRQVVRGAAADFRARPELGPPDSLAARVIAQCAEGTAH